MEATRVPGIRTLSPVQAYSKPKINGIKNPNRPIKETPNKEHIETFIDPFNYI